MQRAGNEPVVEPEGHVPVRGHPHGPLPDLGHPPCKNVGCNFDPVTEIICELILNYGLQDTLVLMFCLLK